jgi:hypothetical protein
MSRRKKPRMLSFTSGPPTPEHVHTKFPTLKPSTLYHSTNRARVPPLSPRGRVPKERGGAGMSRRKKPRMLSFTSGPPTPKHAHTKFPTLKP